MQYKNGIEEQKADIALGNGVAQQLLNPLPVGVSWE